MTPEPDVRGVPCRLTNPDARRVLGEVLDQIRDRCPDDHATLLRVVTDVRPVPAEEVEDGTMGQWGPDDEIAYRYGGGDDALPGVMLLDQDLPPDIFRGTAAHELGHACTTYDDRKDIGGPDDEFDSELAADRYAYKWGFEREVEYVRPMRDHGHHCVAPGQEFGLPNGRAGEMTFYRVTDELKVVRVGVRPWP